MNKQLLHNYQHKANQICLFHNNYNTKRKKIKNEIIKIILTSLYIQIIIFFM